MILQKHFFCWFIPSKRSITLSRPLASYPRHFALGAISDSFVDICTIYKVPSIISVQSACSFFTTAGNDRSNNRNEIRSAKILTCVQKEALYFQVWSTSSLPNNGLNGKRSGKQWFFCSSKVSGRWPGFIGSTVRIIIIPIYFKQFIKRDLQVYFTRKYLLLLQGGTMGFVCGNR